MGNISGPSSLRFAQLLAAHLGSYVHLYEADIITNGEVVEVCKQRTYTSFSLRVEPYWLLPSPVVLAQVCVCVHVCVCVCVCVHVCVCVCVCGVCVCVCVYLVALVTITPSHSAPILPLLQSYPSSPVPVVWLCTVSLVRRL